MTLLHDFGRIGLPDAILGKQDPLDKAEREVVCTHPVIGEQIVLSRSGSYLRVGCYGAASGVSDALVTMRAISDSPPLTWL